MKLRFTPAWPLFAFKEMDWLRGPLWDLIWLSFGWVPFYLWALTTPLHDIRSAPGWDATLAFAAAIVLGPNFIHRHYVLLLVYGDSTTLRARPWVYALVPIVFGGLVALAVFVPLTWPWYAISTLIALWNVWHVVQQRFGIQRAYARRVGGVLGAVSQSRFDMALGWACIALTAAILLGLRADALFAHPRVARGLVELLPWVGSPVFVTVCGVVSMIALAVIVTWFVRENRLQLGRHALPRWLHLLAFLMLLGVFVVHGPVLGFLCFGLAHSLEYVGFVHHNLERRVASTSTGMLIRMLFASVWRLPLIVVPMLLVYVFLQPHWAVPAFVIWYTTTSLLHYLYDGWIWKTAA